MQSIKVCDSLDTPQLIGLNIHDFQIGVVKSFMIYSSSINLYEICGYENVEF